MSDDYEYMPMYEETEGLEDRLFHTDAETLAKWAEVARSNFPSPVVLRVTDHGASLWCGNMKALVLNK